MFKITLRKVKSSDILPAVGEKYIIRGSKTIMKVVQVLKTVVRVDYDNMRKSKWDKINYHESITLNSWRANVRCNYYKKLKKNLADSE